tara:strand:+ start:277 stop:513 length:237 start_codon:yes stop_codon:yes gene_type:complete
VTLEKKEAPKGRLQKTLFLQAKSPLTIHQTQGVYGGHVIYRMHFVDVFFLQNQAGIEEFHVVGVENGPGQFHAGLQLN